MSKTAGKVHIDRLRNTLRALGYAEALPEEAASLVHHLLSDLRSCTAMHLPTQSPTSPQAGELSASDLSAPSMADSTLLQAVEDAQARIRILGERVAELEGEKLALLSECGGLRARITGLEGTLVPPGSRLTGGDLQRQAWTVLECALDSLPEEQRCVPPGSTSKSVPLERILALTAEAVLRLGGELKGSQGGVQNAQIQVKDLSRQCETLEGMVQRLRAQALRQQAQLGELGRRLHQCDFELSLCTDVSSQQAPRPGLGLTVPITLLFL